MNLTCSGREQRWVHLQRWSQSSVLCCLSVCCNNVKISRETFLSLTFSVLFPISRELIFSLGISLLLHLVYLRVHSPSTVIDVLCSRQLRLLPLWHCLLQPHQQLDDCDRIPHLDRVAETC